MQRYPSISRYEVVLTNRFIVHRIAGLDLDARIYDRNQFNALSGCLFNESLGIRENVTIPSPCLIGHHMVKIHVDGVERQAVVPVALDDSENVLRFLIAPPILLITKGPPVAEAEFCRSLACTGAPL